MHGLQIGPKIEDQCLKLGGVYVFGGECQNLVEGDVTLLSIHVLHVTLV
jgi:hypothetical protein